jgi:hypothetical protein
LVNVKYISEIGIKYLVNYGLKIKIIEVSQILQSTSNHFFKVIKRYVSIKILIKKENQLHKNCTFNN